MHDDVLGNLDLLTEILLRLPVKDVIRFKCVCKKLMSIISDFEFCSRYTLGLCRKHKHKNNPNPYLYPSGILFQEKYEETLDCLRNKKAFVIPFTNNIINNCNKFIHLNVHVKLEGTINYRLLRSCNGLQLWDSTPPSPWSKKLFKRCRFFYINNSSTGRCVRIDQFGHDCRFSRPYLVFEPWKSPHYKVIFLECTKTTPPKMNVYSSETGSWSTLDTRLSFPNNNFDPCHDEHGVYCNGAIHWYNLLDGTSAYLDIDQLCFKNLPQLPLSPDEKLQRDLLLGESGGNLYLIPKFNVCERYDIWELKEDYTEWILKYHVDLTILPPRGCFDKVQLPSLCVFRQPPNEDEREESICAILIDRKKLVSYNLKDYSYKILCEEEKFFPDFNVHLYFETLASI